jgi:hypothetical protein
MPIERFEQLEVWQVAYQVDCELLTEQAERVGRMLTGLIKSLRF